MASDLARAITAMVELDRAAYDASVSRQRLRETSEQVAVQLLTRLRGDDEARLDSGVIYRVEQVTWPMDDPDSAEGEPAVDPRGARGLLREDHVLVAGTRKHGTLRVKELGHRLARLHTTHQSPGVWDVRPASDTSRVAFAEELAEVVQRFGLARQADGARLDQAALRLLTGLADLLTTPD